MIRIGFVLEFDSNWLGGVNYYRNLLNAIYSLPARKIEPVIFTGYKTFKNQQVEFPPFQLIKTSLLDRYSLQWWLRKILMKVMQRDILVEILLRKIKIQLLSHSGSLGKGSKIPCFCWLADFQYKRMPQFFEADELRQREITLSGLFKNCRLIILSSEDAKNDLLAFYPDCHVQLEVLQFVSEVPQESISITVDTLEANYGVVDKYFLMANQFWKHKNHQVIIDALEYLKLTGRHVLVVATGKTDDYRQTGFYEKLLDDIKSKDVQNNFKALGVIPFSHLSSLMRNSVAMINPSLFEGWNTAVEEAKSLGKKVILSDIPVHREQNPARAIFFMPDNAIELAEILWTNWILFDKKIDQAEMKKAELAFTKRQQNFALRYQELVIKHSHDMSLTTHTSAT